jgi:hypothetical protein
MIRFVGVWRRVIGVVDVAIVVGIWIGGQKLAVHRQLA